MVLTTNLLNDIRDDEKARIGEVFTHGAIGTDNTPASSSDTALYNEVFRDSIDDFDSSATGTAVVELRVLTNEANGNTIQEVGWFNASSGGTMWARNVINAINKTSDIQLFLSIQITFNVTEDTS
jgi:hypothetical protein